MKYSLIVHGGAGHVSDKDVCRAGMTRAVQKGEEILTKGGTALDAVISAVSALEDDPAFNAGKGSVLNEHGNVEMEASVMDGKTLVAGAVAAIHNVKNPAKLAQLVMEESPHVMLVGEGAMDFGKAQSVEMMPDDYFITEFRKQQLAKAKEEGHIGSTAENHNQVDDKKYGTVGAVACDRQGNLAAATSTGGRVNKQLGRVADTSIIGAGTYADNETCAVSTTGNGEQFIRTALAKTISDIVYFQKVQAQEAAESGIRYLVEKVNGLGGVIVVDRQGRMGSAHSTHGLPHAFVTEGNGIECRFTSVVEIKK